MKKIALVLWVLFSINAVAQTDQLRAKRLIATEKFQLSGTTSIYLTNGKMGFGTATPSHAISLGATDILSWQSGANPEITLKSEGNALELNRELRIKGNGDSTALFGCSNTDANYRCFASDMPTDTYNRFTISLGGQFWWGDGVTNYGDTTAYRAGAGHIKLLTLDHGTSTFSGGYFSAGRFVSTPDAWNNSAFVTQLGTFALGYNANYTFVITGNGQMSWADSSSDVAVDTTLYRSGAGSLTVAASDGGAGYLNTSRFTATTATNGTAFATYSTGASYAAFAMGGNGTFLFGPGSSASDTALYRSGAASLTLTAADGGNGYLNTSRFTATTATNGTAFATYSTGATYASFAMGGNGTFLFGPGSSATDTTFWRSGTGMMSVSGTSAAGYNGLILEGTGTQKYGLLLGGPSESAKGIANKFVVWDGKVDAIRLSITDAGAVAVHVGGSANKAICWKADGVTLGYCSSVVAADGSCTCN